MMALKELRVLAVEMIQPFKDDPHVNRLDACIPRMSEIEVEIKSFARALMSKMETLGCNSFLTKAQIVLARRYHQNELTWYTDDYSAYEARESITFYRQHGHAVFAHALQLKFFLEQPVISESDIIEFAACRTQSLEDFAQFESHGLVVIPATFLGSQLFLPKTFIRNPSIYKLVAGDKRLDCLGRTVSHLCHDDGLDIDWLQNHVNHADILDRTALYLACYAGKEGHVQKLLGMGARSDQRALNGLLPLQVAAIRCSDLQNMCRNHLMHSPEKSAETSAQIIIDRSPVLWAAFSGNLPAIKTLMGRIGSTTKVRDNLDCTPIGLAACMGHTEVVTFLLLNGFERDHPDKRGRTPFWYAARYSRLDIMKLLIPLVQIDKEDNDGTTPLAAAARFNCTGAVALLLESSRLYGKLNLTAKDNIDLSPFIKAALGGSTGCLKLLLKHEPLALDNIVVEKLFEIALNSEDTGLLHFVRRNFKVWSIPRVMHHKPLAYPCEAGFEGFKSMSNIINSFSFV
jgi:ankyrin repeat protein